MPEGHRRNGAPTRPLLDEREWRAWRLVEYGGLDRAEAAERLGTSPAAVRGLLFRARRKLVRALDSLPPDG